MLSEVTVREHLEAQGTLTFPDRKKKKKEAQGTLARGGGSARGILGRELIGARGTLAHGHVSARGILARGHVIVFKVCYSRNHVPFYLWQIESVLNTATVLNTSTAIFAIDFYRVGKHIGWKLFWYMLLVFYRIVS